MIEYHADDYGLFPEQSKRILRCIQNGACNGISIMPNSPHLKDCMHLLRASGKRVRIAAHLNLVEGQALMPPNDIPMLTDRTGTFCPSFGRYLLLSMIPGFRDKLRRQICLEFRAQIRRTRPYLDSADIRLDSHMHFHMLPAAFDALLEAIRKENLDPSNVTIRIPREHIGIYRAHRAQLDRIPPLNLVKVALLNLLSRRNARRCCDLQGMKKTPVFAGVMLSGRMTYESVLAIRADLRSVSDTTGRDLELLFHPGGVSETTDIDSLTSPDDRRFLTDVYRHREANALIQLLRDDP